MAARASWDARCQRRASDASSRSTHSEAHNQVYAGRAAATFRESQPPSAASAPSFIRF
jgi:hypothetical protein